MDQYVARRSMDVLLRLVAEGFIANFEYDLAGTRVKPCWRERCVAGTQVLFPQDHALGEMQAESDIAVPLC